MYRDSQYGLTIDISGPDGNVFNIFGVTQSLCKQLGWDSDKILEEMKQDGDYEGVVRVFKHTFRNVITVIG